MLIGVACMVSLRSTLVPGLSVIFITRENFRNFPPNTKFPENLQPLLYSWCFNVMKIVAMQQPISTVVAAMVVSTMAVSIRPPCYNLHNRRLGCGSSCRSCIMDRVELTSRIMTPAPGAALLAHTALLPSSSRHSFYRSCVTVQCYLRNRRWGGCVCFTDVFWGFFLFFSAFSVRQKIWDNRSRERLNGFSWNFYQTIAGKM